MKKKRTKTLKRAVWPAPSRQQDWMKDGAQGRQMRPGEPFTIDLVRDEGDKALRGHMWTHCCDCGLRHFDAFEVFVDADNRWWMTHRAWRDQGYMTAMGMVGKVKRIKK